MRKREQRYAVCVKNRGYRASLELGKIYQVLPDNKAAAHGLMRVIDESGEDYLHSAGFFVTIHLPDQAKRLFLKKVLPKRDARAPIPA
jgi:hypothetical protein